MTEKINNEITYPCPECGSSETQETFLDAEEVDNNLRVYRCNRCENVFNTIERIIPGSIILPP